MAQRIDFTTPVGRLVGGSLYKGKTTDDKGNPLIVKTGANKGQQRTEYSFAQAIPKIPGQHWANYPRHRPDSPSWGEAIWAEGNRAFPNMAQNPAFSWKVIDGDSTIPNKKGKRPCDREGYPGNWVLWFSSGTPPTIWNANGSERITQEDAVKPGYFIQVMGNVAGNGSDESPGVYLNHSMVALAGYGPEIIMGPDVEAAGFGQGVQLPPGASSTPVAGFAPPAVPSAPVPQTPAAPPQVPVTPNPGFVTGAGAAMPPTPASVPSVPAAPQVPVPPAGPQMTAKANGVSYATFIGQGWTDALLREHGYMV